MSARLSVLVVDDSEDDCLLELQELERAGFKIDWKRVQDESGLRAALEEHPWDVALLDHAMPGFDGHSALAIVRESAPSTIPIVVSGSIGEELAVESVRRGASDYVLKDRLRRLPVAVRRELSLAEERHARLQAETRVREMARHDAATGLPNRTVLEEEISARLAAAEQAPFALVVIEVERLSEVRQAFGHAVVDELLCKVGQRISESRPSGSTLTSLGTHEFGLLIPDANQSAAELACADFHRRLDEPVDLGGVPIQVEVTIGITLHPGHGDHPSLLLRHACEAAKDARASGGATSTYKNDGRESVSVELILLGELRAAIEEKQILLEYQPVVDLKSGAAVSVEALARWSHPLLGRIMPGSFIPQAETCALIQPLTRAILRAATEWNARALRAGHELRVAVNFASRNLLDPGIVPLVQGVLAEFELPPGQLEIEITEGTLMVDPTQARSVLERLRALGITLAIDDFGTGYSSFAYLRDLPVHKVKIDRSFVSRMTQSKSDAAIVQGMIDLGHTLGLQIVAEGIEDELSLNLLSAFGCDLVQGYHIGRPMGERALAEWIEHRQAHPESKQS